MKSSYSRRDKRDLQGKIVENDLKSSGYHYKSPSPPSYLFYSASGNQKKLEELPLHREITGEYLETDPEIADIFSQKSLTSNELFGAEVYASPDIMEEEQDWREWWDKNSGI